MRDHQYAALGVARAQLVERGLYPACETDHRLAAGRWIVDRRLEPAPVAFPIFRAHSLQRAALPRSQPDLAQAVHRDRREAERGLAGRRRVARAAERARVESVEAYRAEAGGQRAGLIEAARRQRRIEAALEAPDGVPRGLAVPNQPALHRAARFGARELGTRGGV